MNKVNFGRIEVVDERDKLYPIGTVINESIDSLPNIKLKEWWDDGWWGDQGNTYECVAYSWMHYLEDGPVIQDGFQRNKPFYETTDFFDLCQKHDRWEGEGQKGTSVRAGAKILHHLNIIESYHWATSMDDVINCLKYVGPMVAGTRWYRGMSIPETREGKRGVIRTKGKASGGHAYVLNGIDEDRQLIRIKNSWGQHWGQNGHAYISFDDFNSLLETGGDACIAFESKMNHVPELLFS